MTLEVSAYTYWAASTALAEHRKLVAFNPLVALLPTDRARNASRNLSDLAKHSPHERLRQLARERLYELRMSA